MNSDPVVNDRPSAPSPPSRGWWDSTRNLFRVVMLVRFSVIMALLVAVSGFLGQGQEALLALAGSQGGLSRLPDQLWFLAGLLAAAFSIWYSARVMYCFCFDDPVSNGHYLPRVKRYLPRVLAAGLMLGVAAALVQAAQVSSRPGQLYMLAAVLVAIAVLFFVLFARRGSWFGMPMLHDCVGCLKSLFELPRSTRGLILLWYLLGMAAMLLFTSDHDAEWAAFLGPLTLVYIAVALMVPVGSWLVYIGNRYNIPMVSIILLVALGSSYFNDNHHVRQTADMLSTDPFLDRQQLQAWDGHHHGEDPLARFGSLDAYIEGWLEELQAIHGDQPIPVIIVAAEGGGIRAAYWTSLVLSELHDRAAAEGLDLPRHILAISGVSGGSLGGATYGGLVAAAGEQGLRERSGAFLGRDFLSPILASMLFPDLAQRFIPWPLFDDRAMALEQAWERGWQAVTGNRQFVDSFDSLYRDADFEVPLLFFNSTVVETGQQMVVHPLAFRDRVATKSERERRDPCLQGDRMLPFHCTFADALDSVAVIGDALPLSTAVHLSARFTFLSPAGTIRRVDQQGASEQQQWIRVVDGGYFENSGEVVAGQVLLALRRVAWNRDHPFDVRPVIVHLSNEPLVAPEQKMEGSPGKRVLAGELLSPLRAIFNTREARGFQARNEVQNRIVLTNAISRTRSGLGDETRTELDNFFDRQGGLFLHFRTCGYDVPLPLGWMLSDMAKDELERQMPSAGGAIERPVGTYNDGLAKRLLAALKSGDTEVAGVIELRSYAQCLAQGEDVSASK